MNLSMVPRWEITAEDAVSRYSVRTGTTSSPSISESDVKPARSANITVRDCCSPPGSASMPRDTSVRTSSVGMYFWKEARPRLICRSAVDRPSNSRNRDGMRAT
jgi:hypothetical protein